MLPAAACSLLTCGEMSSSRVATFKPPVRAWALILLTVLGLQMSCGTLFYPERRGQTSGRIDGGVAVMDGLLFLLFIIPGVVALVVDFGNGTIYAPGGNRR